MRYLSLQQGADKILRLSQRMLAAAQTEDWQGVINVEQERQRSIDSLFRHPELPGALATIASTLQEVIVLDKRCMSLGMAYRSQLARELDAGAHGQHAMNVYRSYRE